MKLDIDKDYLLKTAEEILKFNSPTGFCFDIIEKIRNISEGFGYKFETTNKGNGIITIEGLSNEKVMWIH